MIIRFLYYLYPRIRNFFRPEFWRAWYKQLNYRCAFGSTWYTPLFNPFYLARHFLRKNMAECGLLLEGSLLDVGCGSQPYRDCMIRCTRYVGLEYDTPAAHEHSNADFFYNGTVFPFADAEFDNVLCNQVLEHVFHPHAFLSEIKRVLKPGGKLLLTVPLVWDEHEAPYDFARYTSFGLQSLLTRTGFEIVFMRKSCQNPAILCQLWNVYLYKKLARHPDRAGNMLLINLLTAPVNLFGILSLKIFPDNPDFYLDNIVLAKLKIPSGISSNNPNDI